MTGFAVVVGAGFAVVVGPGRAPGLRRHGVALHPSTARTMGVGFTAAPPLGCDLEVQVRGAGVAGLAHVADDLPRLHGRADLEPRRDALKWP